MFKLSSSLLCSLLCNSSIIWLLFFLFLLLLFWLNLLSWLNSLFKLLENEVDLDGIDKLSCDTIRDYLLFANHYAAYSTTKKGAIASYTNLEEIQEYIKNR